ncbi:hypothetical protein Tco_1514013 [Tanacetum coccineum]
MSCNDNFSRISKGIECHRAWTRVHTRNSWRNIRWLDDEIPRNRIPTLRRDLLGVARFLRWVEAEMVSPEIEMKRTSFPEMEYSGSVVASIPDVVEDQNKALSDT